MSDSTASLTGLFYSSVLPIIAAMLAGGLIGLEREYRDKSAGFRTFIFIAAGSALFTLLSRYIGGADISRIAANIVTGIGFLGAGAILREGPRIAGLTTAAIIWLTAGVGMAMGAREYLLGGSVTLLALVVLWLFPSFERRIDRLREQRVYEMSVQGGVESFDQIHAALERASLRMIRREFFKESSGLLRCRWVVLGSVSAHEQFVKFLLDAPFVVQFRY
ncbi:MAG: MgtC/SapB family protein [Thermanaerothrix sp.]|nr:MgtC/SapB family protein [Thermanaerothrix sp.]